MTFLEVIVILNTGQKVRRQGWMPGAYLHAIALVRGLEPDFLMCEVFDQKAYGRKQWTPRLNDLNANDWEKL